MQDLIHTVITNDGPRVDSRELSPHLDTRHRDTLALIKSYSKQLQELGILPFQTEKSSAGAGRPQVFALLNEDQCYFVLTLVKNTERAVALKLNLVKSFRDARAQLAQRDVARLEGKQARRAETDAIKALVDYAKGQGSKSAEMYYVNITRMTNDLLGISAGERDHLDPDTLKRLALAETMVDIAIRDGIKADLHYKQVRALAKDRVVGLLPLLGRAA
ncbi:MAG: Rha family transcriptional regulator [Chromatiaceae bacterium]|nr:Rha family transcriptional regulator [Chromatiaceae bacterium]